MTAKETAVAVVATAAAGIVDSDIVVILDLDVGMWMIVAVM